MYRCCSVPTSAACPDRCGGDRLELLARDFDVPLELSAVVDPSISLVQQMESGRLEGIVLKDRTSPYRDGTRVGWSKVKDRSWYERDAWWFHRR
jgi:hypothetical protein